MVVGGCWPPRTDAIFSNCARTDCHFTADDADADADDDDDDDDVDDNDDDDDDDDDEGRLRRCQGVHLSWRCGENFV